MKQYISNQTNAPSMRLKAQRTNSLLVVERNQCSLYAFEGTENQLYCFVEKHNLLLDNFHLVHLDGEE